jgi:hypothetical protein
MDNPSSNMVEKFKNPRKIALLSVLAALCLGIQLAPRPPNVEFTSLFTFVIGFVFGIFTGVLFGSFIMFINGFFSPWGFSGLNMPFQIMGMALIGLVGGVYKKYLSSYNSAEFFVEVAVLGGFLTVIYDLITNLGVAIQFTIAGTSFSWAAISALAYGTPFTIVHVVSNSAVFGIAFSPLIKALNYAGMVKNLG